MQRLLSIFFVALLFFLTNTPPISAAYFGGLGDLAGGNFINSFADGVDEDGSTVVGSGIGGFGREAFLWNTANGMQGIGDLPGGDFRSNAYAVSADGSIVVGQSSSGSGDEAFLWNATGGMLGIGDLPGGDFSSIASDVSADGSTIVGSSLGFGPLGTGNRRQAFLWNAADGMLGIGDLPGGSFSSSATSISADGSTVAGESESDSGTEAFLWNATDGMLGLGDLPGGTLYSDARGISADGSTVVGNSGSSLGAEAFAWDAANGMQGLGMLEVGSNFSDPRDVSGDGSIVVGIGSAGLDGFRAFIWDAVNGMRRVSDELDSLGAAVPAGWVLQTANAISADGTTIVGTGFNPNGELEAWIAVVPEPSTALSLSFGLVGLIGLRLRRRRASRSCD